MKGVAVFTNQTCDATQGRKVEGGVHLRTLWGELAYQLGGKALYERVRANDQSQRVPQGLFFEILQAAVLTTIHKFVSVRPTTPSHRRCRAA
ncbi:hypothetical protein [Fontivita pretiosa]|uniref:hypothetical protein n=1 Tax=Fontivita pretiosa TaxID=2989684 RepID=UPI003D170E6D